MLDKNFAPVAVIDIFVSLIWTDRYYECGDFELKIPAVHLPEKLTVDMYLSYDKSDHIMIIESIQLDRTVDDGDLVTVSGRSLEILLDRRVIKEYTYMKSSDKKGLEYYIRLLINQSIIAPSDEKRKISNFIFEDSKNESIAKAQVECECQGISLYDAVSALCRADGIGFHIYLDSGNFVFQLYQGKERPFVVFSESMNNVASLQYLDSVADYKNAAFVMGEENEIGQKFCVYAEADPLAKGLNRRETAVDSTAKHSSVNEDGNIVTLTDEEYIKVLENDGKTALNSHRTTQTANGEIDSMGSQFVYGENFKMGDIVSVDFGLSSPMLSRVVETTFSTETDGFELYSSFETVRGS